MHHYSYLASYLSTFFFFNDPATTEIYTLSLHDALPISERMSLSSQKWKMMSWPGTISSTRFRSRTSASTKRKAGDRKSTRLNSSHVEISYAVFCLKKKKKTST